MWGEGFGKWLLLRVQLEDKVPRRESKNWNSPTPGKPAKAQTPWISCQWDAEKSFSRLVRLNAWLGRHRKEGAWQSGSYKYTFLRNVALEGKGVHGVRALRRGKLSKGGWGSLLGCLRFIEREETSMEKINLKMQMRRDKIRGLGSRERWEGMRGRN